MNSDRSVFICVVAMVTLVGTASAQATFQPLGFVPGGFESYAMGLSGDKLTVVGYGDVGSDTHTCRWPQGSPIELLGELPGGRIEGRANAASYDGSVVVGYSENDDGFEAFVWTQSGGLVGMGDFPGANYGSSATGVSDDGTVIVGHGSLDSPYRREAFRWTQSTGMISLGDLPGGLVYSQAYGVSGDGEVIVGSSRSDIGTEPFRWTQAGGMVGLGHVLPTTDGNSAARGTNSDGSVIVGQSRVDNQDQAFRWTQQTGVIELSIPDAFGSFSAAYATSDNGLRVVGIVTGGGIGLNAVIWTEDHAGRLLQDVLEINYGLDLTGWKLLWASDISADGTTIVGYGENPDGRMEAWIATIPTYSCPGDIADDSGVLGQLDERVTFGDFLALLGLVGPCPGMTPGCDGDIADDSGTLGPDGMVDFGDLLALLRVVGPCP